MKEQKTPGRILTVVIRDDSPMIHCGDSPAYRSVQIELTDEQLARIGLRWTYSSGSNDYYEEISRCFIEPSNVGAQRRAQARPLERLVGRRHGFSKCQLPPKVTGTLRLIYNFQDAHFE